MILLAGLVIFSVVAAIEISIAGVVVDLRQCDEDVILTLVFVNAVTITALVLIMIFG